MPAPIVIANLTPATKMGNESPKVATRADLRDGSRGDSGNQDGGGGVGQLTWSAPNGLVEDSTITVSAGSLDFGVVGPELVMLMESHRMPVGEITIDDITFGSTVTYSAFDALGAGGFIVENGVTALPGGKGVVMGARGDEQNPTGKPGGMTVLHGDSTRVFESRTFYWPRDKQDAAAPYLRREIEGYNAGVFTWQIKTLWNMADKNFLATDTDIFVEPGTAIYDNTTMVAQNDPPRFKSGMLVSSNSIPGVYFDHKLRDMSDPFYGVLAEPLLTEYWFDQGSADGVTADGFAGAFNSGADSGPLSFTNQTGLNLAEVQGETRVINSFTYPGYIRGFNVDAGLYLYDYEVYKTIGPGAFCRVAICDNEDYYQSSKRTLLEIQAWSSAEITARIRQTWFDLTDPAGLWLCVIGADNQQIASVPF